MRLKISARKSDLARLQAYQVGKALLAKNPSLDIHYSFRESLGDKNLTDPLWKMPEKGVFTEDFVQDLLDEKTDLVVHSWKDLPTALRSGTKIVATLPRADQRDLLLFKKSSSDRVAWQKQLQVFSSSPRRAYNLDGFFKEYLPFGITNVQFHNVRGNIQTRVRKLMEDPAIDALVLAKAAMDRLLTAEEPEFAETRNFLRSVLAELRWMVLPLTVNPNASAQGALAVEIKDGRAELETLLQSVHCADTFACAEQERNVLASYGGGCHQKIGVAVLPRAYGKVFFLRGLTDGGEVLAQKKLLNPATDRTSAQKYEADELCSSLELSVTRQALRNIRWPENITALWVAKAEAWPSEALVAEAWPKDANSNEVLIWTAGLQTWKKLAARKTWVHGSAESLGEEEDPRLEVLHGGPIRWTKLSHTHATVSKDKTDLATYEIHVQAKDWRAEGRKAFFWHSGSQFLAALEAEPELINRSHSCGPGSTYKVLRKYLGAKAEIEIYLDEEEWRSACSRH